MTRRVEDILASLPEPLFVPKPEDIPDELRELILIGKVAVHAGLFFNVHRGWSRILKERAAALDAELAKRGD